MSGTNNLGITITARDANASTTIGQLKNTIQELEGLLKVVGGSATDASGKITAGIQAEINAINKEITARTQQQAAIKATTAAINAQITATKELGNAAAVVHRSLSEALSVSFGANADRVLKSASDSAKTLATSLSAAAEADARLRDEAFATANALRLQEEMAKKAAFAAATFKPASPKSTQEIINENLGITPDKGAAALYSHDERADKAEASAKAQMVAEQKIASQRQKSQIEEDRLNANYANRDVDLINAKARAEAEYENQNIELIKQKARAEAEYQNQSLNAQQAKQRAEAEYENQSLNAQQAKQRAEAEYQNRNLELIKQKQRTEAEYINQGIDAARAKAQAEAEYENQNIELIARKQRAEAEYENQAREAAKALAVAEAEYANANIDLIYKKQRAEAEYTNQALEAAAIRDRKLAEYENADIDRKARFAAQEAKRIATQTPAGIIGQASPSLAAATATAQAIKNGATEEEALAKGAAAATAALERQAIAARAVEAAEKAAAAAGASASEIQIAGARAATLALEEQARSNNGSSGAHGSNLARSAVSLFDESSRGQRGAMFATLGAAAKNAGLSVAALTGSMAALVVVMAALKTTEAAENMGKFATETKAAAAAAGLSLQDYSGLQSVLVSSGLKANEADASLKKFAESLAQALADPASKAATAFHNLFISQEELEKNGTNVRGALDLLGQALRNTADSANKTENMEALLGSQAEKLIPILNKTKEETDQLIETNTKLGRVLNDETADTLEKTGDRIRKVGEDISSGAIPAMVAWGPVIATIAEAIGGLIVVLEKAITTFAKMVTSAAQAVGSMPMVDEFGRTIAGTEHGLGGASANDRDSGPGSYSSPSVKRNVPALEVVSGREQLEKQMAQDAEIATRGMTNAKAIREKALQAEIADLQKALEAHTLNARETIEVEQQLAEKQLALRTKEAVPANSGAKAAHQAYEDFAQGERLKISEAQGSASKILAIYDEWIAAANGRYKQHASVVEQIERAKVETISRINKQNLENEIENDKERQKTSKLDSELGPLKAGTYNFNKQEESPSALANQSAKFTAEAQQVEEEADKIIAKYKEQIAAAVENSDTQKALEKGLTQYVDESKQEEIELYKKAGEAAAAAAKKAAEPFVNFFNTVGNQFEQFSQSAVSALLFPQQELIKRGLTTVKESLQGDQLRSAARSLVTGMAGDLAKTVQTSLSHAIASSLSGGASNTIGELLGNWLTKGLSSIAPGLVSGGVNATSNATSSAAIVTAAGTLTTAGTGLGAAAVALNTSAAALTASAASNSGGGVAGVVGLASLAGGGIIPSAAGGMISGGLGGSLAILHPKEMVLPAAISQGVQNMIANQNSSTNTSNSLTYSPTINTSGGRSRNSGLSRSDLSQTLSSHGNTMLGQARTKFNNGWRAA